MPFKFRHVLLLPFACAVLASPSIASDPPAAPSVAPTKSDEKESPPATAASDGSGKSQLAPPDLAQGLVLQALGLIGVTYRWGGSTPETGLDCSGFIRYVFQQALNIALPHNAFAISRLGEDVERDDLKPGDLVFFNTLGRKFSHVGIYLGDDRFIHSPSAGSKIQIVSLKEAYWQKHYNGAKRVTQDTVSERQPKLGELVAEEHAAEGSGKKHSKHGKHSHKSSAKKKSGHKKKH